MRSRLAAARRSRPTISPRGSGSRPASVSGMVRKLTEVGIVEHRALSRRAADRGGSPCGAGGAAPSPPAGAVPRPGARDVLGSRPCRGRGARARALRGARGADRRAAGSTRRSTRTAIRSPRPSSRSTSAPRRSLDELPVGAAGRFVRVSDSDPEMLRYLAEHGIALGDRLEVVDRQPFGGPVFVRFGEREHPIGGELARAMRIETEEGAAVTPPPALPVPALEGAGAGQSLPLYEELEAKRARASALAREGPRDAVHARPRVRRVDRLRRPGELRHQRGGRRAVRLHTAVGGAGGEPGRDGDPVPVGQARDRHRPQLPRGRARQIPPRVQLWACGCRPRSWRCRPTSPSSSAPRSG